MYRKKMISTAMSRPFIIITSLTLIVLLLGTNACSSAESSSSNSNDSEKSEIQDAARVINVEVSTVSTSRFTDYIQIVGDVEAFHDVTVSAEEGGVLEKFYVEKGFQVEKGQVIAKLKDDVLVAQVDEARAAATLAQEQFSRQQKLWTEDKIGSELTYLQSKSATDAAAARLRMLKARLEHTVIRAPIRGILDERYIDEGEMAMFSAPLVRIVAVDKVKITGGVPERFALAIQKGDKASVSFDVWPQQIFSGQINFVGNTVEPRSRTFPIEITMDNPGGGIKPSMVASVRLVREHLPNAIVVPRQVVLRNEDGYKVYVTQTNGGVTKAVARNVELGPANENRIVVKSGLDPGDLLISVGHQMVDDGSVVRVVNTEAVDGGKDYR